MRWSAFAQEAPRLAALIAERFDDAANLRPMGGHGLLNLSAERPLADGWRLLLRLDNALDKDFETARTYATDGRTATIALRWAMR